MARRSLTAGPSSFWGSSVGEDRDHALRGEGLGPLQFGLALSNQTGGLRQGEAREGSLERVEHVLLGAGPGVDSGEGCGEHGVDVGGRRKRVVEDEAAGGEAEVAGAPGRVGVFRQGPEREACFGGREGWLARHRVKSDALLMDEGRIEGDLGPEGGGAAEALDIGGSDVESGMGLFSAGGFEEGAGEEIA